MALGIVFRISTGKYFCSSLKVKNNIAFKEKKLEFRYFPAGKTTFLYPDRNQVSIAF
jgi:hypothetical protein